MLASLLLNRITLQPGQALYLPGGNLHAYLSGVGIEIMANSDNVLRGGLTPKHVDVPELMKVLDFTPGEVPVLHGDPGLPGEWVYPTPAAEFRLSRLEPVAEPREITHDGPQVLLTVEGEIEVSDAAGRRLTVPRGRSVWIAAGDGPVWVSGTGSAFRATDGLRPADDRDRCRLARLHAPVGTAPLELIVVAAACSVPSALAGDQDQR